MLLVLFRRRLSPFLLFSLLCLTISSLHAKGGSGSAGVEKKASARLVAPVVTANRPDGETVPSEWADELTLYAIPAPWGMNWTGPRSLVLQAAKNRVTFRHIGHKHFIGHVFIRLRNSSRPDEELTGMTTVSTEEELSLVLQHRWGFGVLAADMEGKLEPREKLEAELPERYQSGLISWIRFMLSPENADRLRQYLDEYRKNGNDRHYGGANRPRYGEGGGCSPFGVSFVDVAGLMEPEYHEHWKRTLRIPRLLFGGPQTGLRIQTPRVMTYARWAQETEPHFLSEMWDPSLIHEWVRQTWEEESRTLTGRWIPEGRGRARGLVVDARTKPAPDEPIWLQDPPGTPHPFGRQTGYRLARLSSKVD